MKKIIIGFILLCISSCASSKDSKDTNINISPAQEELIQERLNKNYNQQLASVFAKISDGGKRLCNIIGKSQKNCIYSVKLVAINELNSNSDSKDILITKSLMDIASTTDELAIFLGHQYAHNILGHKNNPINTIEINSDIELKSYSESDEKKADYLGLYIAAMSGYKITKAENFWKKIEKNNDLIYSQFAHNLSRERYIQLEKTISEIENKEKTGQALVPNFKK